MLLKNVQQEFLFQHLISDFDQNKQATLNEMYFLSQQFERNNRRIEMEQMEKRITKNVMENLSVSADVSKALQEIEELRRAIDRLAK